MENELFSFKLKSHPHLLLIDHLAGVVDLINKILLEKHVLWNNTQEQNLFCDLIQLAGWCHDLGKATADFQNYLLAAENGQSKKTRLSQHQSLSALFTYWVVEKYTIQLNTSYEYSEFLPLLTFLWVKKHHGNLRNLFDEQGADDELGSIDQSIISKQINRISESELSHILNKIGNHFSIKLTFSDFKEKWLQINEKIYPEGKKLYKRLRRAPDQRLYFIFQWYYSLLLTADKYHAMLGTLPEISHDNNVSLQALEQFRTKNFASRTDNISKLRKAVYEECISNAKSFPLEKRFLSLNVPTGSGKTLAGLAAALVIRERLINEGKHNPKIIYCLPFMSIIDQNFAVFSTVFNNPPSSVLLKHHSLAEMAYSTDGEKLNQEYDADEAALLIEGWDASIVVTTFVQFFHTIIGNRNMMIRRLHQLTGSIIILDEIQTLPHRYWPLIENLFEHLALVMDCRFILMTATLPRLIPEEKTVHLVPKAEHYFKQFDRYQVKINIEPMTIGGIIEHIQEYITSHPEDSILIIVNTTRVAREIFQKLRQPSSPNNNIFHLSTRLTPKTRLSRIGEIKQLKEQKTVVSTQLVEAGVDLDFHRVIRDFSPLDSLNQAAGRCNREGSHQKGNVEFINLVNEKGKPYYRYIYGKQDLIKLFSTREVIEQTSEFDERQFIKSIRDFYTSIKQKQGMDLAIDIQQKIGKLSFAKLAEVKLIQDDYPIANIFIPEDKMALEVWQKYTKIAEEKRSFEKRTRFLEIKPILMQYVISVPEQLLPENFDNYGSIYYLPPEELNEYYSFEFGFHNEKHDAGGTLIF